MSSQPFNMVPALVTWVLTGLPLSLTSHFSVFGTYLTLLIIPRRGRTTFSEHVLHRRLSEFMSLVCNFLQPAIEYPLSLYLWGWGAGSGSSLLPSWLFTHFHSRCPKHRALERGEMCLEDTQNLKVLFSFIHLYLITQLF